MALCCACCYSLVLLHRDGYAWCAAALLLPTIGLLWHVREPGLVGCTLRWQQGAWTLECPLQRRVIVPLQRITMLPWLIYVSVAGLRPRGASGLWLFVDSMPQDHWRQLRARLRLEPQQPARSR